MLHTSRAAAMAGRERHCRVPAHCSPAGRSRLLASKAFFLPMNLKKIRHVRTPGLALLPLHAARHGAFALPGPACVCTMTSH